MEKTREVVLLNAWLDLRGGRFASAENGVNKYLRLKPECGEAYCLKGEIERQKEKGDPKKAIAYYEKAVSLDPSYPASYKAMGLIFLKEGNKVLARQAFESYLSFSEKSSDEAYIRQYIRQCQ